MNPNDYILAGATIGVMLGIAVIVAFGFGYYFGFRQALVHVVASKFGSGVSNANVR